MDFLLIAVAGVCLTWWSWLTWPDVLIDFGRELYVPWQITQGKVLYVDIAYFNGPFSPYLNSLWFGVFGVSIRTLVLCNLAILAVLVWLMYSILSFIGTRLAATAACLIFLVVFAFGQLMPVGNFNFVCPYAHEMTHGIVLSVAAIFFILKYLKHRRIVHVAGAGLALGLAFLTKPEVFAAAAVSMLTGLGLALWTERPPARRAALLLASVSAAFVIPLLAAFGLLHTLMSTGDAWRGILGGWPYIFNGELKAQDYYRGVLGTLHLNQNLTVLIECIALYSFIFIPAAGVGLTLRSPGKRRTWIAVGFFLAVLGLSQVKPITWSNLLRPLPLVVLILGVGSFVLFLNWKLESEAKQRMILRVIFAVFALGLLAKIILRVRAAHYGFALAMPGTLLAVVAILDWIPALIKKMGGYGGVFRAASLALLLAAGNGFVKSFDTWFSKKTYIVGAGADSIKADYRAYFVNSFLEEMNRDLGPESTLLVIPEGVSLNYFLRRVNPTPYINFMPPELIMFGEENILAAIRNRPPDYIAIVHKQTDEYGLRYFGTDFGQKIYSWVMQNYAQVKRWGEPPLRGKEFGILLLKRKDVERTYFKVRR